MKMYKRLAAMLVAVMMVLSMTSALAVELPVSRAQAVLNEGKSVESNVTLSVDAQTITGLLAGMMSNPNADPAEAEEMNNMINLVAGALGKLKVQTVSNKTDASGTIGTDKGSLMDYAVSMNEETGENAITLSLVPGYTLAADPELIKSTLEQSKAMQQNPQMAVQMMEKYLNAAKAHFESDVVPNLKVETGSFDVNGATYTKNMSGGFDTKMMAGITKALAALAKDDAELKALLDPMLQNASQENPESVKSFDELVVMLDEGADELLAEEAKVIFDLNAYENEQDKSSLVEISTPYFDGAAVHATIATVPTATGLTTNVEAILKSHGEAEGEADAAIDWAKVKQDVATGVDMMTPVIKVQAVTNKDEAANESTSNVVASVSVMGIPFGFHVDSKETLTGVYQSMATMGLTLMSPTPLLTVNVASSETDKQPVAPVTEGTTIVPLKSEMTEEDMAPLAQVVKEKGLPQLLENINTALPEEANVLIPLLQQMMTPPALTEGTTQAN